MWSFNRTSMESKLVSVVNCVLIGLLLIEPVWNRNSSRDLPYRSIKILLIEPVWNRNIDTPFRVNSVDAAFNRTSMESKRRRCRWRRGLRCTFNRTSMESKPGQDIDDFVDRLSFNRTSMESKLLFGLTDALSGALLIEPVWNRNAIITSSGVSVRYSF